MKDAEGIQFLQWCLPRLRLRWEGCRKVRRQVYKRIDRRMQELGLSTLDAYRSYLDSHDTEWTVLETLTWIPISRLYRDKGAFQFLEEEVLPHLARILTNRGETELRCWSLGCASGEEPYTLAILWRSRLAPRFPAMTLRIVATDIDMQAIQRAEEGCYGKSSVKDLPEDFLSAAFVSSNEKFCIKSEYREPVSFLVQDVREVMPPGLFHLILCRYLVLTYFDEPLQCELLPRIAQKLAPGGALVVGTLESLPRSAPGLEPWSPKCGVYRKEVRSNGPSGGFAGCG